MQYTVLAFYLLSSLAAAAPTLTTRQGPSTASIADAANSWAADTSVVSQFLSAAGTLSGSTLTAAAQNALNHENDELTHKAVLDQEFGSGGPMPDGFITAANDTLVENGTFQVVVNGLQNLATNGASMTADEVNAAVEAINEDRCGSVLPAIDAYLREASKLLNTGTILLANRPDNCPTTSSS